MQHFIDKKIVISVFAIYVCISANCVHAAPSVYSNCELNQRGTDSMVLFDKDCKNGYVFPPPIARMQLSGSVLTVNDEICSSVNALQKTVLGSSANALQRGADRQELVNATKNTKKELSETQDVIVSLNEKIGLMELAIGRVSAELGEIREQYQAECESVTSFTCSGMTQTIDALDKDKKKLVAKRDLAELKIVNSKNEETRKKETLSEINESIASIDSASLENDTGAQADARRKLLQLRNQAGAVLAVSLTNGASEELDKLVIGNPTSNVRLQKMRWLGGSLYVAPISSFTAPESQGFTEILVPGLIKDDGTLFINAASVKLNLDVVSACNAFNYNVPSPDELKEIESRLSANVVAKAYLNYSALTNAKIKVQFNYNKFYEYMSKQESKNGFFKTKKIREIKEKMTVDNELTVEIVDEGNVLDDDTKSALVEAMRNRVVQRALDALGAKYTGVDSASSLAEPQAGAPKLSAALRMCTNVYCQAGAIVVDVAHAIFGGSNSIETFTETKNLRFEETYDESKAVELTTDFIFTTK